MLPSFPRLLFILQQVQDERTEGAAINGNLSPAVE